MQILNTIDNIKREAYANEIAEAKEKMSQNAFNTAITYLENGKQKQHQKDFKIAQALRRNAQKEPFWWDVKEDGIE